MTRPNYDGPVHPLLNGATVTQRELEFRPDGTAYTVVSGTPQVDRNARDDHDHPQRQVQNGDGQCSRQSSAPVTRGFSIVEVAVAMGMLTVVSLGVAQLFAASTKAQPHGARPVVTTILAAQKLEQIRSLTWGFDKDGMGLPVTDVTTNLTVYPLAQNGTGLNAVARRLARAEHGRVRRLRRRDRQLGRYRPDAAGQPRSTSAAG